MAKKFVPQITLHIASGRKQLDGRELISTAAGELFAKIGDARRDSAGLYDTSPR